MSSSTRDDLLEAYASVSAHNRSVLERFAGLGMLFEQQGIRFLVLKGADVISRLYGVRGTRPLSDVDLLVDAADLPAIDGLLSNRNFVRQIDGNPSYASSDLELSLDLVTSLWYLDEQGLADVWSRAIRRPCPPLTITCLSTEDLLIHLTAYAVVHRGQLSPAFSQDVHLLIEQESPDWTSVVTRAREYDLQVPLHYGLGHVRAVFPAADIPDVLFSRLAPAGRRDIALAWLFRRLVTRTPLPDLGHLLLFLTRPRGRKWSWLSHTLFPSETFLSYRYGRERKTAPLLTRLLRLCHLLAAACALSVRVILRLIGVRDRRLP